MNIEETIKEMRHGKVIFHTCFPEGFEWVYIRYQEH